MTILDSEEHDALIRQTEAIKNLCRSFDEFKEAHKKEYKDLKNRIDDLADSKVSLHLFFFTTLIIIGFLTGLMVYTGELKNNVVKIDTCVNQIQKTQDNQAKKDINNMNFRKVQ